MKRRWEWVFTRNLRVRRGYAIQAKDNRYGGLSEGRSLRYEMGCRSSRDVPGIQFGVRAGIHRIHGVPNRNHNCSQYWWGTPMLHYTIVFLVIALIAAVLGFSGIAAASAGIAKILFFLFLIMFLISLLIGRRTV